MTNTENKNHKKKSSAAKSRTKPEKTPVSDKEIKEKQQVIDKKLKTMPKEIGGRSKDKGLEPTRYGDWEFKGRCIDF